MGNAIPRGSVVRGRDGRKRQRGGLEAAAGASDVRGTVVVHDGEGGPKDRDVLREGAGRAVRVERKPPVRLELLLE